MVLSIGLITMGDEMITHKHVRGRDNRGAGYYGASRGSRVHNGVDLVCEYGEDVICQINGVVSKLGYPYANDLSFRYVQITDEEGYDHRYFYVSPQVAISDIVERGQLIGVAQNLAEKYSGITPHVHYEVKYKGQYVSPFQFFD